MFVINEVFSSESFYMKFQDILYSICRAKGVHAEESIGIFEKGNQFVKVKRNITIHKYKKIKIFKLINKYTNKLNNKLLK